MVDGLKGFPEAINAVFPQTIVQTCIVHLIRHSMDFASWKDRKSLAQALRTVYRAADAAAGQAALDAFAQGPWGAKYPAIAQSWRRNWELVIPFFAFPEGVRRIIYTTDEIDKSFLLRDLLFCRSTGDRVAKSRAPRMPARPRSRHGRSSLAAPVRRFVGPRRCHRLTNCS